MRLAKRSINKTGKNGGKITMYRDDVGRFHYDEDGNKIYASDTPTGMRKRSINKVSKSGERSRAYTNSNGTTMYKEYDEDNTSSPTMTNKKFADAFREARVAGLKEFTWRGKRYNTKLKGE